MNKKSKKQRDNSDEITNIFSRTTQTVFVRDYWKNQGRLIPATITTIKTSINTGMYISYE